MSAPCLTIIVLSVILLMLTLWRWGMELSENRKYCEIGSCKTIGKREVQEDFFQIVQSKEGLLAVLADGMGKELGGKIAARKVTEVFVELFGEYNALDHPHYFFQKAFQTANREVLKLFDDGRGSATASAIMLQEGSREGEFPTLYYAIVGNVKVAVFRNDELVPLGTGHTIDVLAEDKYYRGDLTREDALTMLETKRVYNYIGKDYFRDIEIYDAPVQLKADDIVVLMSDGIYEGMDWKELEEYLSRKEQCQQIAFDVVEHINRKKGNTDNACIVLIRVGERL